MKGLFFPFAKKFQFPRFAGPLKVSLSLLENFTELLIWLVKPTQVL